jgi:hypothetical protein
LQAGPPACAATSIPHGIRSQRSFPIDQVDQADALGAKIGEEELRQASILLDRVLQAVGPHAPDALPTDSA